MPVTFGPNDNPRPAATPPVTGGRVRVATLYVPDYFRDEFGLDDRASIVRKRDKLISAMRATDAATMVTNLDTRAAVDLVQDGGSSGP